MMGMSSTTEKIASNCKFSCEALQYIGKLVATASYGNPAMPIWQDRYQYRIMYQFINLDNKCQKLEEYLVYDAMAMIGSVGGTFGLFVGFSMTGVIASVIEYLTTGGVFKKCQTCRKPPHCGSGDDVLNIK